MNARFVDFVQRFRALEQENAVQDTSSPPDQRDPIDRRVDAAVLSVMLKADATIWSPDRPFPD